MSSIPSFAFDLSILEPVLPLLPIVVGCGVGLIVLGFLSARLRGRKLNRPRVLPPPPDPDRGREWERPESSFADRRTTSRREGAPVQIVVSASSLRSGPEEGYVLDRSTGGLRIALSVAVAPGSMIQVRATNAPDTTPWVSLVVRNCRDAGQHFELGCEFERTPPWNVLLLFG